ncbi:MAG: hypothetical protein LC796_15175 [Acidobacteria bacterium]|nr:hypothetical protein [Acidobacteriota bacterium]MCA1609310.1 hypothetical protein [Acidobacteriota bacterium]
MRRFAGDALSPELDRPGRGVDEGRIPDSRTISPGTAIFPWVIPVPRPASSAVGMT